VIVQNDMMCVVVIYSSAYRPVFQVGCTGK